MAQAVRRHDAERRDAAERKQRTPVPITGVWLRNRASSPREFTVLVRFGKQWRSVIVDYFADGIVDHVVTAHGIELSRRGRRAALKDH